MAIKRIEKIRKDILQVFQLEKDVDKLEEIRDLSNKLDTAKKQLQEAVNNYYFYSENNIIEKEVVKDLVPQKLINKTKELKVNFSIKPDPEVLTDGNYFKEILDNCKKVYDHLAICLNKADENFFNSCYQRENSEQLQEMFPLTPENKKNLSEFKQYEIAFLQEKNKRLTDATQLDKIRKIGKLLVTTRGKFSGDFPEEVKRFVNSIEENGYAPFSMLTPIVLKWIKDTNLETHYQINQNRNANQRNQFS